jgi:hypothetical protein
LASRKNKKGGTKSGRDPEPIEVEDVDPINSSDREEFEQPQPQPAKRVNGEWVNPEWDDADAEWKFPEGVEAAEKAAKATKKAAEKAGTKAATSKTTGKGARDILAELKGKKKETAKVERIDEDEEEEEELPEEAPLEAYPAELQVDGAMRVLIDYLVEKVAEKLKPKK